ncbi:hypothetical protein DFH27DRAFT_520942 [Peziza echinospora]|nr:hypothetical protein DFH27DRAFT_520942 [Peziza echinospora]
MLQAILIRCLFTSFTGWIANWGNLEPRNWSPMPFASKLKPGQAKAVEQMCFARRAGGVGTEGLVPIDSLAHPLTGDGAWGGVITWGVESSRGWESGEERSCSACPQSRACPQLGEGIDRGLPSTAHHIWRGAKKEGGVAQLGYQVSCIDPPLDSAKLKFLPHGVITRTRVCDSRPSRRGFRRLRIDLMALNVSVWDSAGEF